MSADASSTLFHGRRILVFDSGIGGWTVSEELRQSAPGLQIDYAADAGFFPYGDKSDDALRARLPVVARALVEASCPDVFVMACNTASTLALAEVRAALDIPVVGTVPAIKPAAAETRSGVIGLLATPGTVGRAYTRQLIDTFARDVEVTMHGTVALVALAEAKARREAVNVDEVAAAQAPIFAGAQGNRVDTVVLACTHFPLLRAELAATAPRPVTYIDSGAAIARQTLRVLETQSDKTHQPRGNIAWLTGSAEQNAASAQMLKQLGYGDIRGVEVPSTRASAA